MASPAVQEEQLLELLLQLKKTTPEQAKVILNSQPQITYALMAIMVNAGAINMDVVQKTLASYGALPGVAVPFAVPSTAASVAAVTPAQPIQLPQISAIPPHVNPLPHGGTPPYQRGGTPSYPLQDPRLQANNTYPPAQPYNAPPSTHGVGPSGYGGPPPGYGLPPPARPQQGYGGPPPLPGPSGYSSAPSAPQLPEAFANISEEQKALIMRVVAMTPDEIARIPAPERSSIIQLRQTLGLPS